MTMDSLPTRARTIRISLFSYGHSNGPIVLQQQPGEGQYHRTLAYNIRHLPNPPRHLRANGATGLSRRLQKEFLQNDSVEAFLIKVQAEISDVVRERCGLDQPFNATEPDEINKQGSDAEEAGTPAELDADSKDKDAALEEDADIDLIVTICCEEGRHRSVAFVEELARRLNTMLKNGDGISQHWQLDIHVTHRDIEDQNEDCAQSVGKSKRPSKAQAKVRQRERREKGNRYTSGLEGEDDLD
ncbi:hypothetical protein BJX68DRAFT_237831 [Aspergillus pseudodeflectus]|uniref:RapZ C-terminal domain-containing protein n=1 Tax=Aspergillus pseudodeflectus TaxID=176178 RepID=A0ABR4KAH1_9EURO